MKICFICDTAYQVLTCYNIIVNSMDSNDMNLFDYKDLYLSTQFRGWCDIYRKLSDTNIFDNIIIYNKEKRVSNVGDVFKKIYGIISPKYKIKSLITNKQDIEIIPTKYDSIFLSVPTDLPISLYLYSDIDNIIYYDDGIGSYIGEIYNIRNKTKFIYRMFFKNISKFTPNKIILNNTKINISIDKYRKLVVPAPPLDEAINNNIGNINDILGRQNLQMLKLYSSATLLYFTQPNDLCLSGYNDIQAEIIETIKKHDINYLVRLHPRDKNTYINKYRVDDENNMWEFIANKQITDNHVLLASFSTSQMIPKMIFNKEPHLIFLYPLFEYKEQKNKKYNEIVDTIKGLYRDKSRIYILNSIDQLNQVLNEIDSKQN